jgi:hypothetical protein
MNLTAVAVKNKVVVYFVILLLLVGGCSVFSISVGWKILNLR